MNLLDATVKEVLGPTYCEYGMWFVEVVGSCWGRPTKTLLMFGTLEEALAVDVGYKYLT